MHFNKSLANYIFFFLDNLCYLGFPGDSVAKNPLVNVGDAGDAGSIDPWVGRIPWRTAW